MRMNGWGMNSVKYYLVGNAIVWWSGTLGLISFVLSYLWYQIRFQRKHNDFAPGKVILSFPQMSTVLMSSFIGQWDYFCYVGWLALGGWLFHFGMRFLVLLIVPYVFNQPPVSSLLDHGQGPLFPPL
jgi:dolichyl-phosphate-mannose-protein mannosyltransferase